MEVAIVVVGTSLGGLVALKALLAKLPADFRPPMAIVQHRGRRADQGLVNVLARETALPVCEPDDKQPLEPGHVYVAPADYHLLVEPGHLALSTEAPVNYARPSVDVLFESAAQAYGRGVVAVILSGANEDGAEGCARIKERGGTVLVQEPAEAEGSVMPRAAIAAGNADRVLPMAELSAALRDLSRRGAPA